MTPGRSLALYRRMLWFLTRDFRRENGDEMERLFVEALEEAQRRSVGATVGVWLSGTWDIATTAVLSRISPRRHEAGRPNAPTDFGRLGRSPHTKDTLVLESLVADVWHTLRSLRKSPGFSAIALLTLGLGVGATTLVFTVVHSVLLKPLPYEQPDRLVNVWNDLHEEQQFLPAIHPADFRDYQEMSETFEEFSAASGSGQVGLSGVLTGNGPPLHVDLSPVTHNFFSLLGVEPILGRHFTEDEEVFNGPDVAMISHGLWQSRFGGDGDVVGRTMELDGQSFEIVGVLPPGFRLLLPSEAFLVKPSDVWVPLQVDMDNLPPRNWTYFTVFGRLQPNVTLQQAQVEMDQIATELRATYPEHVGSGMQIRLVPLQHDIVKESRSSLLTLFGAVGFVLLIACANVAHLLLLRGNARQKELAMRTALGASRNRIARQMFTESVVLALVGAGLGLLLTVGGLDLLAILQPPNLPRLDEVTISGPVLGFTLFASLLTAVLFGLAPALHASRTSMSKLLKEGGRSGATGGAGRARNLLMIAEVALSVVLLVGTGLMIRSFSALQDVRPGFHAEPVLSFSISLPRGDYPSGVEVAAFYRSLEESLAATPGVEAVGAVSQLPLTGSGPLWPYAYDDETSEHFNLSADGRSIMPGYFEAIGTRLIAGRFFDSRDIQENQRVVIVDEGLAARAWPNEDPIGQQLELFAQGRFSTVVGVVEHTRIYDLTQDVRAAVYVPHGQNTARTMSVVVKASGDPLGLAAAARDQVWGIDSNLPVNDLRPMHEYVSDAMAGSRFMLLLMSMFGGFALVLASVGIYGVISYAVRQRSHEFGVRMALGASPSGLVKSVVYDGARLLGTSIILGIGVSVLVSRSLRGMLFGVSPTDASTYALVAVVLSGVALLACYVPARRSARIDPVNTLRAD